jgi:hypothetical protein
MYDDFTKYTNCNLKFSKNRDSYKQMEQEEKQQYKRQSFRKRNAPAIIINF